MNRKRRAKPYTHGRWKSNDLPRPSRADRRSVWSYVTAQGEEFHLDVYDGNRYVGHVRWWFRVRRA